MTNVQALTVEPAMSISATSPSFNELKAAMLYEAVTYPTNMFSSNLVVGDMPYCNL